jgi:hypothetical protein
MSGRCILRVSPLKGRTPSDEIVFLRKVKMLGLGSLRMFAQCILGQR